MKIDDQTPGVKTQGIADGFPLLVGGTFYSYTSWKRDVEEHTPFGMAESDGNIERRHDADVVEKSDQQLKEPDMFQVLLHNDHYTTMDFVIEVLRVVFHKSIIEATKIMLDVHRRGVGVVGTFTHDIAQTKATLVREMARKREFPLRCTVEKV